MARMLALRETGGQNYVPSRRLWSNRSIADRSARWQHKSSSAFDQGEHAVLQYTAESVEPRGSPGATAGLRVFISSQ